MDLLSTAVKNIHCFFSDLVNRDLPHGLLSPSNPGQNSYSQTQTSQSAGSGSIDAPLHEFILFFLNSPSNGLPQLCASEDSNAVSS